MAKKKQTKKKPTGLKKRKVTLASKAKPRKKAAVRKKSKAIKKKSSARRTERDFNEAIPSTLRNSKLRDVDAELVAAIQDNAKAVQKVLPRVADINKRIGGRTGFTALMLAAYSSSASVVKTLLANGANATADPVLLATAWEKSKVRMLIKAGADPNVSNGNETPLSCAIDLGEREVAKLLLDAGAEVTDEVRRQAKRLDDAGINKLLGLTKPAAAKLYIPPLLSKPMKEAYRKVYEVTGWPPLGVEGLTVFRCQIEPDRFLDAKEALSHSANDKAAKIVTEHLFGSVAGCEFVRSDIQGECVLMMGSNNKFFYWKKPKKLLVWLKSFDAEHPMALDSIYSGVSTYQFTKRLTKAQCIRWNKSWDQLSLDSIEITIESQKLVLSYDT